LAINRLVDTDTYFIPRISSTDNMDSAYLLEVCGNCPLCGKYLLAKKGKRTSKKYQIAHIYPNSPTPDEIKELEGLERLGSNCEEFENKIALCKDCHGNYDDHKTKDEYLELVRIKKELMNISNAKKAVSFQDIEQGIIEVINIISQIDPNTLKRMELDYQALKISDKIEDEYCLLKNKIEMYVSIYFNLIKETFRNLAQTERMNFELVASEIKTSFLKCEKETINKSKIFNCLVEWLKTKTKSVGASPEACEAVISYFVQNCEVFREITK
jgi:hypothetical protein